MGSIFPDLPSDDNIPKTFDELWNSLASRDKQKYEYLRAHQSKILEELQKKIENSPKTDYAISLPTGTGKTLVGLMMSYYLMLREKMTAIYLCPNIFLCDQVLKDAHDLDIPAVPLYKNWNSIDQISKDSFTSGLSIGVATYSTLFNSNPRVGKVGIIVMDDIHAAGDSIISNWSIKIDKTKSPALFEQVYKTMKPSLNSSQKDAIEAKPSLNESYEMLYSKQWLDLIDDISSILDDHSKDEELKYQWRNVKKKLQNYCCIIHHNSIEIRPLTPPSYSISSFKEAKLRFYMSATLDNTGNLENNVGIEELEWISLDGVDIPGNRMILNLNTLIPDKNDESRVISIADKINKTIILTQSSLQQSILKNALQQVKYDGHILAPSSQNISSDMSIFKNEKKAVLLLAGRYDGIDLGNGVSDGIVMYHLPQAINSFESFTTQKWETKNESEARAIQRVHQGMGRCTRKISDEVQIFLVGDDLVKLILNPQTLSSFPGKLKKELEYCRELKDPKKLDEYLAAYKEKNKEWITIKDKITKEAAKVNVQTVNSSSKNGRNFMFSKYSNFLWTGNYEAAQMLAVDRMREMIGKGNEKDSAIWAYLGGEASDISAFMTERNPFTESGNGLFSIAVNYANKRDWFGTLSNYINDDEIHSTIESEVKIIFDEIKKFSSEHDGFNKYIKSITNMLESRDDKNVKKFLKEFGTLLGFETLSPSRDGSPDCIWYSGREVKFIFEAKTDKKNDCLSIKEVRQIISLPEEVKSNEKLEVSSNLLPICITDVQKIADEERHNAEKFFILKTSGIKVLSNDWFKKLLAIQNRAFKDDARLKDQIQRALKTHRLYGTELRAKLCQFKADEILTPE